MQGCTRKEFDGNQILKKKRKEAYQPIKAALDEKARFQGPNFFW